MFRKETNPSASSKLFVDAAVNKGQRRCTFQDIQQIAIPLLEGVAASPDSIYVNLGKGGYSSRDDKASLVI